MMARSRRIIFIALVAVVTLVGLSLVTLSPLILRQIDHVGNENWAKLANIGQTYGVISALLAALALTGVAISVSLQVRESRAHRLDSARTRHFELVKILLEDPFYFQAESLPDLEDEDAKRLTAYLNLRVQFWQMLWSFGELTEPELRERLAPGIFGTDIGRLYWQRLRWQELGVQDKAARKFYKILDEVFRRSRQGNVIPAGGGHLDGHPVDGHPAESTGKNSAKATPLQMLKSGVILAGGIALGIILNRARPSTRGS